MCDRNVQHAKALLDAALVVHRISDEVDCRAVARLAKLAAKICRVAAKRLDPSIVVPETYPWERSVVGD